jgi:hypothetical protein
VVHLLKLSKNILRIRILHNTNTKEYAPIISYINEGVLRR